jgi:hypothetical protein
MRGSTTYLLELAAKAERDRDYNTAWCAVSELATSSQFGPKHPIHLKLIQLEEAWWHFDASKGQEPTRPDNPPSQFSPKRYDRG